jgi:hypothetical protein
MKQHRSLFDEESQSMLADSSEPTNNLKAKNNNVKIRNFLIFSIVSILVYFLFSVSDSKELLSLLNNVNYYNSELFSFRRSSSILSEPNSNDTALLCDSIMHKYETRQIRLDNVFYPQSVHLHLNKSINFTCLNSRSNLKKIFFWNSFFDK